MQTEFHKIKNLFEIPKNLIYLDGNSLGPPTKKSAKLMRQFIKEKWAKLLIMGWNKDDWINKSKTLGNRIAKLIGAEKNSVIVGDTLSIRTYQALFSAIKLQTKRRIILSDKNNFPSDLYIAQGLIDSFKLNYQLRTVESDQVLDSISDDVAILFLTEVDYRTGKKHDILKLTTKAKKFNVITIWDLAHSLGVLPINLKRLKVDFAVGCTYKYLNGGPGSPAFLYAAPQHHKQLQNPIKGWLGHSSPFNFEPNYLAGNGIATMQIGTPSIIAFIALEASLDIFDRVEISEVRKKSMELTDLFIAHTNKNCPQLRLISPVSAESRGAHVAYRFKEGYAVIQCLIEHGVIGDFRAPDLMRFGFNPLFIDCNDVLKASSILCNIMKLKKWDREDLKLKHYVT